jgi:pyruvate/2-oxoglutarate dehydrogenase complex dihydrolipoamide acyltransferase (E2) component
MAAHRVELRLPDFDLGEVVITACSWHVANGQRVVEGDRLLELLAGEVTIDLSAPASGRLVERAVRVDESLAVGQLLAVIEVS